MQQIGPYRIVRQLGEGGMGTVYEAIQEPIERRVALKILLPQHSQNPDVLNRFFNEARAANLIEHPSIVQVSDYGQTPDGTAYLVMECLRGEPLSARLNRLLLARHQLRLRETLHIALQIADALAAAHEASIVHRDLKPANVMLVRDSAVPGGERAKILDFGIAKLMKRQTTGTATGLIMGTPRYMSPEQWRGLEGVDDKTDVYALGVILYEMIAGRPPFIAETDVDYMVQHASQEPPPLQELAPCVPPDVAAFVHRLLARDKLRRPLMREVEAQLARQLSTQLSDRPPVTSVPATWDGMNRWETKPDLVRSSSQSTLVGSSGQRLRPGNRRGVGISILVATTCLLASGAGFFGRMRLRSHPHTPTAGVSSSFPPPPPRGSATVRPAPIRPVPDTELRPMAQQGLSLPATKMPNERQPQPESKVHWTLTTIPIGATVLGPHDTVLGTTPWQHTRSAGHGKQVVRLSQQGFLEQKIELDQEQDEERYIRLSPLPENPAPPTPPRRFHQPLPKKKVQYED